MKCGVLDYDNDLKHIEDFFSIVTKAEIKPKIKHLMASFSQTVETKGQQRRKNTGQIQG